MLYPAGWGSDKVQLYCGPDAAPYRAGLCSMGWAFYTAMGGTVLTFVCAVFSAQAEIATSSDKVQEEIEEGKSLICLLWSSDNTYCAGGGREEGWGRDVPLMIWPSSAYSKIKKLACEIEGPFIVYH